MTTLSLFGTAPALTSLLQEYAQNAKPPLRFEEGAGAPDIAVYYAADERALEAHLKILRAENSASCVRLLVLETQVSEPEEEPAELGLAGVFRTPLRLAALLDAGFFALRMAALKSPRALSPSVAFNPFTRALEDKKKNISEILTPKEADFLLALLDAGEKGLTREAALSGIWHYHREADSHAVETAAWRLRRKLESFFGDHVLESRDGAYYLRV